jgi:hypothetical protein
MQGHELDTVGIGAYLVSICYSEQALGRYLVEINNKPCIKLSEDIA